MVELAQRKEKPTSTAFMAECVKIIMTCTVSISMHTNSLTSVGWSVCVHCQQKEQQFSSPLDWLQIASAVPETELQTHT